MNAKRILTTVVGLLAASSAMADWEGAFEPNLYYALLDDYVVGETLSDKGVKGGTWGDCAQHAITAAREGEASVVMDVTTDSESLQFTVTDTGMKGPKTVRMVVSPGGLEKLTTPSAETKAAFCVYAPAGGTPTFQGWGMPSGSTKSWTTLSADAVVASTNAWYDVSIWLVKRADDLLYAQYRVKVGDAYVPLQDASGSVWVKAAVQDDDPTISRVFLRGHGSFDRVVGKELPGTGVCMGFK